MLLLNISLISKVIYESLSNLNDLKDKLLAHCSYKITVYLMKNNKYLFSEANLSNTK